MNHLYTIMAPDVNHLDEICEDIRQQYEKGVASSALFKMTLVPEGNPPSDKAAILCGKYAPFRDKLNAMGIPKCCYAILCAEEGEAPAPFEIRLRQLDYDRDQAILDAQNAPKVPRIETYIREIQTGIYSR